MSKSGEKCLFCTLLLIAGLVCLFVGWIVWIKTGDTFTTGLALLLMGISFFIRPLAVKKEHGQIAAHTDKSAHRAA